MKAMKWLAGAVLILTVIVVPSWMMIREDSSASRGPESVELTELTWSQLDQVSQNTGGSHAKIEHDIQRIGRNATPASRYLRGLLHLSLGSAEAARNDFSGLEVEGIPARYLYAPFRLEEALGDSDGNPYLKRLRREALKGGLDGLQRGRILSRTGDFEDSLEGYLASDPAKWRAYDVESFRLLIAQPALESSVHHLIEAGKDRMNPVVLTSATYLLAENGLSDAERRTVEKLVHGDKELAIAAVRQVIEARRAFVERRFDSLIQSNVGRSPVMAGDELCLLLFVSAVATNNRLEADRWGQELGRRFDDEETRTWIRSLISEIG
jgi:hypothetical protein